VLAAAVRQRVHFVMVASRMSLAKIIEAVAQRGKWWALARDTRPKQC
jgi:hypothetical protein